MPPQKRTDDAENNKAGQDTDGSVTMAKAALAELLAEGEAAAYARGHAAGLAEAKKLPLFEACKQAAERYWASENDQQLAARFRTIEADYGEKITPADQELILGAARRYRVSSRATEMALEDLTRPRRQPPNAVVVDREITV
ncbi:MAG: hypothetical protein NUW01_02730 [Gemmatimonadaceae bacterium]|nr:hypothetical protein [Gemmatimonadaceae bacterium]